MENANQETVSRHRENSASEQLSVLDEISRLLTLFNFDLDLILKEIVEIAVRRLRVKACSIRTLDEESGELVLRAAQGLSDRYLAKGPVIADRSAFREVIATGEVTEIFDVRDDPRVQYSKEAEDEGILSVLTVGLLREDRPIGALSVYTRHRHHFTEEEKNAFQTIANQAAVAIHLSRLHRRQLNMDRLQRELSMAAEIQSRMLPASPPSIPGLEIAAWNMPCGEIGGDLYDFIQQADGRWVFLVGDVSGKGIPAALLMATVRAMLRSEAAECCRPQRAVSKVNQILHKEVSPEEFVTLFYCTFEEGSSKVRTDAPQAEATSEEVCRPGHSSRKKESHQEAPQSLTGSAPSGDLIMTYVNAGHHQPVLFRENQERVLDQGGVPVGLFPDSSYQQESVRLRAGDLLVFYTDGFVEASDQNGCQFGSRRLRQCVREHCHRTPQEIVEQLEEAVTHFTDPCSAFCDDRTVVVMRVKGTG